MGVVIFLLFSARGSENKLIWGVNLVIIAFSISWCFFIDFLMSGGFFFEFFSKFGIYKMYISTTGSNGAIVTIF